MRLIRDMKQNTHSQYTDAPARSRRGLYQSLAAALLFVLGAGLAVAGEFQPLDSIVETARGFVMQAAPGRAALTPHNIDVGPLDGRLHLARCDTELTAFAPPGARSVGNTTVGVRCNGTRPWSLYVPVRIRILGDAVVAVRPLAVGAVLTAQDVRVAQVDLGSAYASALSDPQRAVGKVLRRPLLTDAVVTADSLDEPRLVRRDEQVTLLAEGTGIEVRMMGQALADGSSGELIRVRNLLSKRVVEGIVVSAGLVRVRM